MSRHHSPEEEEEVFERTLPERIFDASYCGEPVPEGFDAVRISLEAGLKADLSWKPEKEAAQHYQEQGLRILWDMNLGLSGPLLHGLGHQTQFLAFSLSLEHFCKGLWKEFPQATAGLCLYRGRLDFSDGYFWDDVQIRNLQDWTAMQWMADLKAFAEETGVEAAGFETLTPDILRQTEAGYRLLQLFCRDALGEYLHLLASPVSDQLSLFLMFDALELKSPLMTALLLNKERYPRFRLAVKKTFQEGQHLGGSLAWDGVPLEKGMISRSLTRNLPYERPKMALCLPGLFCCRPSQSAPLEQAIAQISVPFRVIPEGELTMEWDGLDFLIVDPSTVDLPLKRKLQGFCAAGGVVVSLGRPLGLPQELSFSDFLCQKFNLFDKFPFFH